MSTPPLRLTREHHPNVTQFPLTNKVVSGVFLRWDVQLSVRLLVFTKSGGGRNMGLSFIISSITLSVHDSTENTPMREG